LRVFDFAARPMNSSSSSMCSVTQPLSSARVRLDTSAGRAARARATSPATTAGDGPGDSLNGEEGRAPAGVDANCCCCWAAARASRVAVWASRSRSS
jgi:hypothetical protein